MNALRTLASPYKKNEKEEATTFETIYYLLVNMKDLPENIPLDVNAVVEPETDFYINNRGIVISAKSLSFNSVDSEVTIDIGNQDDESDRYNYGILDGGHTYTDIIQNRNRIPEDIEKYVRIHLKYRIMTRR